MVNYSKILRITNELNEILLRYSKIKKEKKIISCQKYNGILKQVYEQAL